MFAVFESGGKQHRVQEGDVVRLEKLEADEGASVTFDQVMLVGEGASVAVGTPFVDGSAVEAEVVTHGRADKIDVIKFKRRKNYHRKYGHRQAYTEVRITAVRAS